MGDQRVGIRIEGDASGLKAATDGGAAALHQLDDAAKKAALSTNGLTISNGQLSAAMRQLPAQITDIVTGLASGQTPFTVAIQQGGQIKDSFGGAANVMTLLRGAISPTVVAFGGLALAAGAVALAAHQGSEEHKAYALALVQTNNAAGTTVDRMGDMAREVSRVEGTTHAAADALAVLAGTAAVSGADLVKFATTALQAQRLLGVQVTDTARAYQALAKDPVNASLKLNETTNYLTASVLAQIRAYQAQGDQLAAASTAQKAYDDALNRSLNQAKENLGTLEKAWLKVTNGAKGAWDAMLSVGRPETLQEQLQKVNTALSAAPRRDANPVLSEARREALKERKDALEEQIRLADHAAQEQARHVRDEKNAIEQMDAAHESARAAIKKASGAAQLAVLMENFRREEEAAKQSFDRNEIYAKEYQDKLYDLDFKRVHAQLDLLDQQEAAERSRSLTKGSTEELQRQAALLAIDAQRTALRGQYSKLVEDEAAGRRDITPKSIDIGPSGALRSFQGTDDSASASDLLARRASAEAAAHDLVEVNKRLNIELIRNDRERGEAQISLEADELRKRLDLAALNSGDRERVEDDLARWRVNRERQLTEQLKPEWRRLVEAWGDTNKLMEDSFNDGVLNVIQAGEKEWIKFAQTGKLSVASLGDAIAAEVARATFRQFVGSLFANGGFFGGGGFISNLLASQNNPNYSHEGLNFGGPRAGGGGVSSGNAYLVGEKGPELLRMGSGSGWVTPNEAIGSGGPTELKVTLINETGTAMQANERRGADGGVELVLSAMEDRLADRVANGQGNLDLALRSRYGLR